MAKAPETITTRRAVLSGALSTATMLPAAASAATGETAAMLHNRRIVKSSVVTMARGSPGVITWPNHGHPAGTPMVLSTTGALFTGYAPGAIYFVVNPGIDTLQLAATASGTPIGLSGSQSGVHTATAGITNADKFAILEYAGAVWAKIGFADAGSFDTDFLATVWNKDSASDATGRGRYLTLPKFKLYPAPRRVRRWRRWASQCAGARPRRRRRRWSRLWSSTSGRRVPQRPRPTQPIPLSAWGRL